MRTRGIALATQHDSELDWRHDAECVRYADSVDFFPTHGDAAREAKAICAMCDVRQECLDYSMRFDHLCGVWGGLTERERRQLRRTPGRNGALSSEALLP